MITCPRCQRSIAIPERLDPKGTLRCPRCRTDIPVRKLPPELSADAAANEEADDESIDASAEPASEGKSTVVRRRYYSRTRLPKSAAAKPVRRRRKPKTKFTRGDFVKVILGGMVAFPAAQLILWWGFGRDPFSLGPVVAPRAPFLVPRMLRGEDINLLALPETEPVNPNSSLLQGKPFRFERDPRTPVNTSKTRSIIPNQTPSPILENGGISPINENNDGTSLPK